MPTPTTPTQCALTCVAWFLGCACVNLCCAGVNLCCAVACVSTWVHWLFVRVAAQHAQQHAPIMCAIICAITCAITCGARCCASCVVRVDVMLLRPCCAVCRGAYSGPVCFVCPRTLARYSRTRIQRPSPRLLRRRCLAHPACFTVCAHAR
jgi:hypothetical protein